MIVRIIVTKQAISSFRKAAIAAYPNEFLRTLWGRIQGETVQVSSLRDVSQIQTEQDVSCTIQDLMAPATGPEQYLGSLHSHPDTSDATPSQTDWDDAFDTGEHIFGVMRVSKKADGGFTTELKWWQPAPPIQTIYPKVRGINEKKRKRLPTHRDDGIGLHPGDPGAISVQ